MQKISILMSVYIKENAEYLEQCLLSLYQQTLKPDDLVIVHDGPLTTELYACIDRWRIKLPINDLILKKNVGLGIALNRGLKVCKYELIARMDADDICEPLRLEMQVKEFVSNSNLAICGSNIREFDRDISDFLSYRCVPLSHQDILKNSPSFNPFNHMTVMYKKSVIQKVGGYQHMPWMEDWYLWLRVLSSGYECLNLPNYLVNVRAGSEMILRRSGFNYIKSEWLLTKIKINLGLSSRPYALFVFFKRSLPRVLPKFILRKIYFLARKVNV